MLNYQRVFILVIYKPYKYHITLIKPTIEPPVKKKTDLGPAAEVSGRNGASAAIKIGDLFMGYDWEIHGI